MDLKLTKEIADMIDEYEDATGNSPLLIRMGKDILNKLKEENEEILGEIEWDLEALTFDGIPVEIIEGDVLFFFDRYPDNSHDVLTNKPNDRPSWDEHFLRRAQINSEMATCNRLKVGAVVVKDKRVIGDGFNGSPSGHPHCIDEGCLTNDEGRCIRTIHAEHNAILKCKEDPKGATVYVTHEPCEHCSKVLAQVGIRRVVFLNAYPNKYNHNFISEMEWEHYKW